jgi:SAM-dependent methyltransferase
MRLFRGAARLFFRPRYRGLVVTRLLHSRQLHQTSDTTQLDRYPEIFSYVRAALAGSSIPKILSFGCSTGEELTTLRKYFPNAEICGCDINRYSLSVARERARAAGATLFFSDEEAIGRHGPYDAIFCMAVLQRTPHRVIEERIQDLSSLYPFQKFTEQLSILDRHLKLGGLIAIEFSHYRFSDAAASVQYEEMRDSPLEDPDMDKFLPSGRKLPASSPAHCVHRKTAQHFCAADSELAAR